MKQSVLVNWDLPGLTVSALVIFIVCFAVYAWWTYRKENKVIFDEAAQIPLEEPRKVKGNGV